MKDQKVYLKFLPKIFIFFFFAFVTRSGLGVHSINWKILIYNLGRRLGFLKIINFSTINDYNMTKIRVYYNG